MPEDQPIAINAGREAMVIERLSTDRDLDEVADLEARCFTNPWTRDMLARELALSDVAHVFVLRLPDRRIAAFCSCWIVLDELHVNTLVVDLPFRRRGLGVTLMRGVIDEAVRRGAGRATLEVRESNQAARQLYEGLGFQVVARRRQYYSQPEEDALILWHDALRACPPQLSAKAGAGKPGGDPPANQPR